MGCIYVVTCLANNKQYIGKTFGSMVERRKGHIYLANSGCNYAFHRAIRKYGINNFHWEERYVSKDDKTLLDLEIALISKLKTKCPSGYNMTDGGEGTVGIKRTEEQKNKLRIIHLGKKHSEETKRKLSEHFKGRVSPSKGRVLTKDQKIQISLSMKGKPKGAFSEEHKKNISISRKKYLMSIGCNVKR